MLLAFALTFTLAPPSESMPYRQPQLAIHGDTVGVTFGSGQAIFYSSSTGGGSFSTPVQVFPRAGEGGKMPLGRHRGPRIAFSGHSIVISAVVGEKGGGADGDLIAWHSEDGGKTWSRGVKVTDTAGAAREGLHAMSAGGGIVYAAWLDLRSKGTRLYGSLSRDGGASWSKNVLIYESPDGHICECCHPSVAVTPKGEIFAMWRNWLGGSRDLYVARSQDGIHFGPAQKQGTGTWPLNACPMDGGDVAFTAEGKVWSAWRRDTQVILAAPGGKETVAGPGKDPAMVLTERGPALAWSDHGIHVRVPGSAKAELVDPAGAFPRLAAGGHVYAAWESGSGIRIARID